MVPGFFLQVARGKQFNIYSYHSTLKRVFLLPKNLKGHEQD
nr:MAG TPA: specific recognition protein 1 [Caudoviricetes sp.]